MGLHATFSFQFALSPQAAGGWPGRCVAPSPFQESQRSIALVKLTLRERESIQEAVRRFRKLVERSGIKKEMRRREYYEKPSEIKRRARLRAERRARRGKTPIGL